MNKKLISICALVAMAALVIAGASMAYFSDTVETKGNVLTSGNVDISIEETTGETAEGEQKIIANSTFTRTFEIKNNGTSDAYVRLNATSELGIYAFKLYTEGNNGWLKGTDGSYYYNTAVTSGSSITITLQATVNENLAQNTDESTYTFNSTSYTADKILADYNIVAEAIQTAGFDGYEAAFKAFDGADAEVTTSATE